MNPEELLKDDGLQVVKNFLDKEVGKVDVDKPHLEYMTEKTCSVEHNNKKESPPWVCGRRFWVQREVQAGNVQDLQPHHLNLLEHLRLKVL